MEWWRPSELEEYLGNAAFMDIYSGSPSFADPDAGHFVNHLCDLRFRFARVSTPLITKCCDNEISGLFGYPSEFCRRDGSLAFVILEGVEYAEGRCAGQRVCDTVADAVIILVL